MDQTWVSGNNSVDLLNENNFLNHVSVGGGDENLGKKLETLEVGLNLNLNVDSVNLLNENNCLNASVGDDILGKKVVVTEGFVGTLEVGENCEDNVGFDSNNRLNMSDGVSLNHDYANLMNDSCLNHGGDGILGKNVVEALESKLGIGENCEVNINDGVNLNNDSADLLKDGCLNHGGEEILGKNVVGSEGFEALEMELDNVVMSRNGVDFDSNTSLNLNDRVNSNPKSENFKGFAEKLEPELGVGENCEDNRKRVDFDLDMGLNLNDGVNLNHDSDNMLSNSCLNHGGDEIGEKNVRGSERFTKTLESELGPNKRRRFEIRGDSGNDSANLLNHDGGEIQGKNGFEKTLESKLGASEKCNDDVSVNKNRDLNLNDGFNSNHELDLNVGLDLNAGNNVLDHGNDNSKDGIFIDLNLDANANEEDDTILKTDDTQKKEHCFDLNLGLDDETRNSDADCDGQLKKITNPKLDEEIEVKEIGGNAKGVNYEIVDRNPVKGSTSSNENLLGDVCQKEDSYSPGSFKRKGIFGVLEANSINDSCSIEIQLKSSGTMATPEYQGNLGSVHVGSNSTKRRKLSNCVKSSAKTVLRRSTRAGRATFSAQIHDSGSISDAMNDELSSPSVSVVSEEKLLVSGHEKSEEHNDVPPKLQLPPSSKNLNLDGIPILELFSVYSFLRSFSTILFLSPFELEDFVAALRCKAPNLLIDFIHVCLLRILRKHLEFLSDESSQSASLCLRSLNWDLLDVITWPVYLVEYVLMHSSGLESGINISHLKFFGTEYYEQPESVKIDILQSLCDDVIEVEAIKSELNRRMLGTEGSMDVDRNVKFDSSKKKKGVMDVPGGPCLTDEVVEETTDWNSDECCLCKMDGNLICCDGCPAAFHAKCVGVATNLLPEGDWYCPECVLDKDRPWLRVGKAIRGAELLGFDPYGRLYYSSCGYLLVLDSCDTESVYKYYHRNDLTVVIEALKSSDLYGPILSAITKLYNATAIVNGTKNSMLQLLSVPSGTFVKDEHETAIEGKPKENMISTYSSSIECGALELPKIDAMNVNQSMKIEKSLANSEGSAEISQVISTTQNFQKTSPDYLIRSSGILNDSEIPGMCTLSMRYVNYYSFARIASSVAEELTRKFSNKTPDKPIRSIEEILSTQMKVISNLSTEFCWSNIENLNVDARKERCGWCFSCQVPDDDRDCLFIINDTGPVHDGFTSELLGIGSKNNRKGHLIDVMCHILCIEDRLRGLLLGPWLNPHYSKIWRKKVLKASDITSVKQLLLMLESNLRPLALSAEWPKHVDTAATMGSASHVVTRMSTKLGSSQKRARCSDLEPSSSSKAVSGLGLFWWRGGSLSRQLFSWKVLPRSLVSKAARQGGCKKIPGILYPDSSEFTKRSKNVAWRASVETSRSADQLALQVREFDANIRWDDIENTSLLSKMDKESRKPTRSFKKVIVRKKCTEGTMVKYLLDFGKKRFIPDIVLKQGSKIEESSNEKKKYWLEECYVPLHLLKGFEERRIARKSNKASSGKLHEIGRVIKKPSSKRGFSYLFSKAERSENFKCGHCNKDVLIREAVSCQYCKGFFHKRHVKKSAGAITAKCTYTCHKCHGSKWSKVDTKKGKSQLEKIGTKKRKSKLKKKKKVSKTLSQFRAKIAKKLIKDKQPEQPHDEEKDLILPLRRSSRKVKRVPILNKIIGGDKQEKQSKFRKGSSEKPNTGTRQKKRTLVYHSYWLNGLQLSRKPNDERGMDFRREKFLTPSEESTVILEQPKCGLCHETEFKSTLTYIQCEICGDWFHGDAFGLRDENIGNLIGFKCHMCRNQTPPVCSHFHTTRRSVALSRRSRK